MDWIERPFTPDYLPKQKLYNLMTIAIYDRVQETTTTSGTGTITLAGAVAGFRSFNSTVNTGDQTYYTIVDSTANAWEVGIGTLLTSTTLSRTTVLSSSNGGSLVSLAGNTASVFIDVPAAERIQLDSVGPGVILPWVWFLYK